MSASSRWLNYHHLLAFRVVAREGSLARAATVLRLSPQTLSEQVQQLEALLGAVLFSRSARGMNLTDAGRAALAHAEEIHAVGQDLFAAMDTQGDRGPARVSVGVEESLSKFVTWDLLAPAVASGASLVVREGAHDHLIELLTARSLDLVVSDCPMLPGTDDLRCVRLRAEPIGWHAASDLARALREGFPGSLEDAPVILPLQGTALRAAIDDWFLRVGVRPRVVGEFADTALAKTACAQAFGAMLLPSDAVARAAERYGLAPVGPCEGVSQTIYALTTGRRTTPAVAAVLRSARPNATDGIT